MSGRQPIIARAATAHPSRRFIEEHEVSSDELLTRCPSRPVSVLAFSCLFNLALVSIIEHTRAHAQSASSDSEEPFSIDHHSVLGIGSAWLFLGIRTRLESISIFFSYQDLGFVRRGLPATVIYPLPWLRTRTGIEAMYWLLLVIFVLLFSRFFLKFTKSIAAREWMVLLLACALSPALFLRFGYDFGRFDIFGVLWLLTAFTWADEERWYLLGASAIAVLLSHEAFIVINLPLFVAYQWKSSQRLGTRRIFDIFRWLWFPLLAFLAVIFWGNYEPGLHALTRHFAHDPNYLKAMGDGVVNEDALAVICRGFKDNLIFNSSHFFAKKGNAVGTNPTCQIRRETAPAGARSG